MIVLQEIPFYLVVFGPWILLFAVFMAWASFVDKLTAKPKPPAHVATPEELVASKMRVYAMIAQAEKNKLANSHHH
jgi:hypothetical protein